MTRALLLVDLQNDYFEDDELRACRDDLLRACNLLVDRAHRDGAPVVEVRTVHAHDRSTWALNMLEDGEGVALEGTTGAQRLGGLRPADHVVVKTRDSAFHGTGLSSWLEGRGVGSVVLAGVSTESCIAATAMDAYAHDIEVTLVGDATASVDPELHDQTLARLTKLYRQPVRRAEEITFDGS